MEITTGAQTYTLSLESIDLSFWSKYLTHSREQKMPLWSKEHLNGEDEYFEVHIEPLTIDESDSYCEQSDTYKCQICDLDVPKIYGKEHNESQLHVKLKNIFEKVLERMSKQINSNFIIVEKDIPKDVYYCEPCAKVIKLKNKSNHQLSDHHRKSVENYNILDNFHKLFNRVDNHENFNENNVPENDLIDERREEHFNIKCEQVGSDINKNDLSIDEHNGILDSDDDTASLTSSIKSEPYEPQNFETYLKEMIAKYKLTFNLPSTEEDFIYMIAPNGDKRKVSRYNFHSYKEINNSIYCQVCKLWISRNTKAHEVTEIHVRNVFKPVNNDFYRLINSVSNHCILCNEIFCPQFEHAQSETHKKILQDSRITRNVLQENKSNYNDIAKSRKTFCEYCNVYIDTHNFLSHTSSKKHESKKEIVLIQNKVVARSSGEFFCICCNISFMEHKFQSHINENSHKNKNKIYTPSSKYCELCDVEVPNGDMEIHCGERLHIIAATLQAVETYFEKKQSAPEDLDIATTSASSSPLTNSVDDKLAAYRKIIIYTDDAIRVKCSICNVFIPNAENNILEHMQGRTHRGNDNKNKMGDYAKYMEYIDDNKTTVKCRICDLIVPLEGPNIVEHMNGKAHEFELTLLLNFHSVAKTTRAYYCDCCDTNFINYLDHINSDVHTENFQNKFMIDRKVMRKFIYDDQSNSALALKYRVLYKNLMRVNEIDKLNDVKFYCNICEIDLCRISEIDHMLGERHTLRKEELEA